MLPHTHPEKIFLVENCPQFVMTEVPGRQSPGETGLAMPLLLFRYKAKLEKQHRLYVEKKESFEQ
jgi:hypothetical protein